MSPIDTLTRALRHHRFQLEDEKRLQADVAEALGAAGIPYRREVRLFQGDVIDFVAHVDGLEIGIEAKIKGASARIIRQLDRYAVHDIDGIVLLTRRLLAVHPERFGIPFRQINLSEAWL